MQAGEVMDREITGTYGGYKDGIPEDVTYLIRKMDKEKAKSMTKLETSFDTRYKELQCVYKR